MKAIVENNETFKITSEKGDFYICESNKGKIKMFAKCKVQVVDIDSMPIAKKYKAIEIKVTDAKVNAFAQKIKFAEMNENFFM